MRGVFLLAYTCSGLAGLIYQVSWTRLITLYLGHSTAAASAVVAAFLGGLAIGAAAGGVLASRLSRRHSLLAYGALEVGVAIAALLLPIELRAMTPILRSAYADGAPGLLFPTVRLLACVLLVCVPAMALGATFPLAIRWYASASDHRARSSSALYALNTAGAAGGALLAGYVLIPALGLSATTYVGMAASVAAAVCVFALLRMPEASDVPPPAAAAARSRQRRRRSPTDTRPRVPLLERRWLVSLVLGLSGFAALVHEIAWTRLLTLVLGPTIYAFAATLAAVIGGVALGSGLGTWIVARTRSAAAWLMATLVMAAMTAAGTSMLAGTAIPRLVATRMSSSLNPFEDLLWQGTLLAAALIVPTAMCFGAAFPLALSLLDDPARSAASRFGSVYAINTAGAVAGSLVAGFVLIPQLGLQLTLAIVVGSLVAASTMVVIRAALSPRVRRAGALASVAAAALLLASPPWDRALLASGAYMYAPFVPKDLDLETQLRAGTLLYYREGAAATVSVKRLTGTTTLAVDGKTDASNRGDMLTQKLIAHLPLLLHDNPREVAIIGLGSGVTAGAALRHPIARVDVIEISPQVVDASRHFVKENQRALDDPRTNLIVGDGRSHLLLSQRLYDVIISEPSNPWIAGVAALFTREFFLAARDRLAGGGVICQWANAYSISDADLRSIVATFRSVFPDGTAWLIGEDDVVLIASRDGPPDLSRIERHWTRPGVADDLKSVFAVEPFALWSLFAAGPHELAPYAADAALLTDDRMSLEFTAPRELHNRSAGENGARLAALAGEGGPPIVRAARASAGAAEWRNRGVMMTGRDAHSVAYDDYVRALRLDAGDVGALHGLVRTAVLTRRGSDALSWLNALTTARPPTVEILVARSQLLASIAARRDAIDAATQAARLDPHAASAVEQLASLHADAGDVAQLDTAVATLRTIAPHHAPTEYYAAVAALLHGNAADSLRLSERAVAIDANYAPVYDLMGAAHSRLGQPAEAREAFLTSLRFDAHDSTAYVNLGILELEAGNKDAARNYFAEALWLEPDSVTARRGLAQVR